MSSCDGSDIDDSEDDDGSVTSRVLPFLVCALLVCTATIPPHMPLVDSSIVELPSGHKVYVAQYQPTERPIEDRYSVDFEGNRVILGVYDGAFNRDIGC